MDYNKKIELINKALQLDPNSDDVWATRAYLRSIGGDKEEATKFYTRAIEINPSDPLHYFDRGRVWHDRGELVNAEADYNQAIALYSNLWPAYIHRGLLYFDKKDWPKAKDQFIHSLNISPESAISGIGYGLGEKFSSETVGPERSQIINKFEDQAHLGFYAAKGIMTAASILWEIGKRQEAVIGVRKEVVRSALDAKESLKKENKHFSATTLKILKNLFRILPQEMQRDPDILAQKNSLGLTLTYSPKHNWPGGPPHGFGRSNRRRKFFLRGP
jgi:tetratricopeptide (TPR) repeat protein